MSRWQRQLRRLAPHLPDSAQLKQPGLLALAATGIVSVLVDYSVSHPTFAGWLRGAWGVDWDHACSIRYDGTAVYPSPWNADTGCPTGSDIYLVIDSDSRTLMVAGVLFALVTVYTWARQRLFRLRRRLEADDL